MPAHKIAVTLPDHPYEIIVEHGLLSTCGSLIGTKTKSRHCALISDSNVFPLHGATVQTSLEDAGFKVVPIVVPAGETSKSMAMASEVCEQMIAGGLDRGSFVVALGGGVVGDLAGFAAAIYYRGIPCIHLPTTVVSQVDSAIGGKTGVNAEGGKNLIGAFHQPLLVLSDTETLSTLSARDFNEGMAEVIKHGVIRDASLLAECVELAAKDRESLMARNAAIKAAIISEDPFERKGLRALLNFGHTVGHAIENVAGYGRFLHGEAISIGIAVALHLSISKAGLAPTAAREVLEKLEKFDLPVRVPADLTTAALTEALLRDKKFEAGSVRFILTSALGSAFVSKDVTVGDIEAAIDSNR